MSTISVSNARATLPRVIDAVERGEEVTLTRHGRPVAVVVRPDALRVLRAGHTFESAAEVAAMLERGRALPLHLANGLSARQADKRVAELRADPLWSHHPVPV